MLVAGIVGGIVLLVLVALFGDNGTDKSASGHAPEVVYAATTNLITKGLKAPSTAKFPSFHDDGAVSFIKLGNDRYKISSYVDSQNSFGAMIRTRWVAIVKVGGGRIHLEDLSTQ